MQTLFDSQTYEDVVRRITTLRVDSARQWGKMSPAQMLEHTSRALEMAIGKKPVSQALIGKLIGWTVRKHFVGEKPFSKNGPTAPWLIVAGEPDFADVQAKTTTLLREFHELGAQGCEGHVHGFFGTMSGAEWGVTQFKHLDHHLRQFGV
ncbi:MAG: DUF1569 domain-containing protein [Vicinamibacterales bacterium]